jgi:hypothetical protein
MYGYPFTLFLIFMILKLTGFILWSWWWVTAPLWAPVAIAVFMGMGAYFIAPVWTEALIAEIEKNLCSRRR